MGDSHEEAERQAAEWLSRCDGAGFGAEDRKALERWLDASSAHAVAFIRLQAAWSQANRLKALGAGFAPRAVPAPGAIHHSPFFDDAAQDAGGLRRASVPSQLQALIDEEPIRTATIGPSVESRRPWAKSIGLALAAAVALVAVGLMWRAGHSGVSYSTPIGVTASVPMKDGSLVMLNTDSKIRLLVTDTLRSVELERGEAFLEVAKDSSRPFVVNAGSRRIVVLGTQFSVRRDGEALRVAVTEGKVRLESTASASSAARHASDTSAAHGDAAGNGAYLLEAGGVARADAAGVLVQSKALSEVQEALSWRTGFLIFRDIDLAQAVAEFNRYSERKIVIRDRAVAAIRLNGRFRANNFPAFIRLLEDGFPIDAQDRDGSIVLTERAH